MDSLFSKKNIQMEDDKMLVLPQTVKMKWHGMNKEWFISKGYTFTKISDEFEVSVLDLMEDSDKLVK